ncbi:DHA2 family multidrug resistance protein-like MFS transporter [Streptomyces sp. SLBN-118]|uniref:MFS transporter n=1 Tax=Streptomyces sp. SLBN-118 TaxID=2768454 RepID=UPI0011515644|nr:MFS transporter [Streptomyces sp. SLBN-118]TQK51652.1 DHA2 family multidrug resistance protein-like MFS transporter [Streptomyces sp. SLBN-118]
MTNSTALRAGRREWTAFVVLLLPLLLVSMDVSVLYFAIPAISRELDPSSTQQLWIFDIYAFALAGLLITMGSLGDRIGRRRLLLIGATAFGIASVGAAYAQSAEMLIGARALLGIGGATLMPSTMALVRNMFTDDKQRSQAIGIWSGAMAAGIALGSVMSGVMLNHFWWGSVFLINVPAMLLLLILVPVLVPEFKDPAPGRFDLVSVPLSMGAVLPVVYGLKEMAAEGFSLAMALCIAAGLAVGALFVRRQRSRTDAMISRELFRGRVFGSGIALNTIAAFAMLGSAYFTTQYLQSVLGMGTMEAALWSLAPSLAVGAAAPTATAVGQKTDRAYVIAAGFLIAAVGFALLTLTGTDSLRMLLAGAAVIGCGIVTVMALISDLALASAPAEKAGSAASLLETGQEFGGALGMAVLGSIGTAVYRADLTDSVPRGVPAEAVGTVRETLGGAAAVAGQLPDRLGDSVLGAAREAFTHGMQLAAADAGVLLLAAAVLAAALLRQAPAAEGAPDAELVDAH